MKAPHGGSWLSYLWRVVRHGLGFAVVGPAVATIFSPGVMLLPLSLGPGYMICLGPCFLAGCCVAIATTFVRRPVNVYLTAGVIGAICTALVWVGNPALWPYPGFALMLGFAGAAAAMVCTNIFGSIELYSGKPDEAAAS